MCKIVQRKILTDIQPLLRDVQLRTSLLLVYLCPHLLWRRKRHGRPSRSSSPGSRVRSVPPYRYLRSRLPHHRGLAFFHSSCRLDTPVSFSFS
jgi:hypothetical protein